MQYLKSSNKQYWKAIELFFLTWTKRLNDFWEYYFKRIWALDPIFLKVYVNASLPYCFLCSWFFSSLLSFWCVASSLRTPMAVPCPYPTPFGIVPHAGMNGELTSPGAAYAGLHNISPQMSAAAAAAAAAAAYGRSPVVCSWAFTKSSHSTGSPDVTFERSLYNLRYL